MASYNAGNLDANLRLNIREFTSGLRSVTQQVRNVGGEFRNSFRQATDAVRGTQDALRNTKNELKDFERIVGGILLSQAFYGATSAIQNAASEVLTFSNNMEKAQIALEYFLGTPERAQGFLVNMKDFAASTAFNTEQALDLSRRLMAAQFDPKQIRGVMEILNDASAASGGTAEQMDRIVLALSQIKTNGKIAGQELRQLAEAGIPIYKILQEELGLTGEQVLNIGDLKISGDLGVEAVLKGLEKRYKGAADRIADTIPGMWETIKDDSLILSEAIFEGPRNALSNFLTSWRDTWEEARDSFNKGGLGQVLEDMVPESLHTPIRLIVGSFKELASSAAILHKALLPVWQTMGAGLTVVLGSLLPVISGVVGAFARLVSMAFQTTPALRYVAAAVVTLMVATTAAKALLFLWNVLRLGTIASAVAGAVLQLGKALQWLFLILTKGHPVVRIITLIAGALLYLAASSKTVSGWLDRIMAQFASLGGFDIDEILQPEDINLGDWADEFNGSLEGIGGDTSIEDMLDDAGKKGKETAKKIEDAFTAAFDEVYQVPDKNADKGSGSGSGGGPGGGGLPGMPSLGGLPELQIPEFPREIELPKFVVPPVDWPKVPPMLMKPINIDFKINWPEWPKLPGPPPAVVTAWEVTMDKLRSWGVSWQAVLEGLAAKIPGLVPKLVPVGAGQGIIDWVNDWSGKVSGQFDALKERLSGQWGKAWEGVATGLQGAQPAVAAAWGVLMDNLETNFNGAKTLITTGAGVLLTGMATSFATKGAEIASKWKNTWEGAKTTFNVAKGAISTAAAAFLTQLAKDFQTKGAAMSTAWKAFTDTLQSQWKVLTAALGPITATMWNVIKQMFDDAKKSLKEKVENIKQSLKEAWDGVVIAIVTVLTLGLATIVKLFDGLGGRMVPSASGLAGKLTPGFNGISKAFSTAVSGIPNLFSGSLGGLSSLAAKAVSGIVRPFGDLPDMILKAIKNIPSKMAEVFGNIKIPSFSTSASGVISASANLLKNIAGFKEGGIIDKDSIIRVGEGGRREAIVPLQNPSAMQPYVDAVVRGVMSAGGMQTNPGTNNQQPLYVGTLIADSRGLKELERKMRIIRVQEDVRGGNA